MLDATRRRAVRDALSGGPLDRRAVAARVGERLGRSDDDRQWLFGGSGGVLKELAYLGQVCHAGPHGPRLALTESWLPAQAAALREAGAGGRDPGSAVAALRGFWATGAPRCLLTDPDAAGMLIVGCWYAS